jgi:hypothetical protein
MVTLQPQSTIDAITPLAATTDLRTDSFMMVALAGMNVRSNFADHPMSHRPL